MYATGEPGVSGVPAGTAGARRSAAPRRGPEITPAKLALDKVGALVAIVLLAPVMAGIALVLRLSGGGPVLFAHRRVGAGGELFNCLKFRTMYREADIMLKEVLETDPIARKEWEQNHKLDADHRVTPLGRFLRKTSLDELPQFFNVLRGDMSLVGPRPVTLAEAKHYGEHFDAVFSVRPGVTGLWQVCGRSATTYAERVAMDLSYLRRASILQDLRIMVQTPLAVVSRRGAL